MQNIWLTKMGKSIRYCKSTWFLFIIVKSHIIIISGTIHWLYYHGYFFKPTPLLVGATVWLSYHSSSLCNSLYLSCKKISLLFLYQPMSTTRLIISHFGLYTIRSLCSSNIQHVLLHHSSIPLASCITLQCQKTR